MQRIVARRVKEVIPGSSTTYRSTCPHTRKLSFGLTLMAVRLAALTSFANLLMAVEIDWRWLREGTTTYLDDHRALHRAWAAVEANG